MLQLLTTAQQGDQGAIDVVQDALDRVRDLLGMELSYISEAVQDHAAFRYTSVDTGSGLCAPQQSMPLTDIHCAHVVAGLLPNMARDVNDLPQSRALKFFRDNAVRSYISIPIYRSNRTLYGMFCCMSRSPNPTLNDRDEHTVRMFAELASHSLNTLLDAIALRKQMTEEIREVIRTKQIETFFQPIVSVSNRRPMAVEALSRFHFTGRADPTYWFAQAGKVNMEQALELAAIQSALSYLPDLPAGMYITLNASPATLVSDELRKIMDLQPPNRVVLELTEHHKVTDFAHLAGCLDHFRGRQIGIAIDDLGAGYAGLNTVLSLNADVIKLDRELVSNIHRNKAKQSLTRAMVHFAKETDAMLIAEGVEVEEEHAVLSDLGVRLAQGYLYSRPAPAAQILPKLAKLRLQLAPARSISRRIAL